MTYCQFIFHTMRNIWARSIPLSLRSKTWRTATPLLLTWIYPCRYGETVSNTLLFTTNVTISTKMSVPEYLYAISARIWCFYLTAHTVYQGLLLLQIFYSEGGTTFILASRAGICQGTFVLWSIWRSYIYSVKLWQCSYFQGILYQNQKSVTLLSVLKVCGLECDT